MAYLPASVCDMAAGAHGLLMRHRLLDLPDVTRHTVDGWVKQGVLTVLSPGAYQVAGTPVTQRQRLLAAVWQAGEDAVAADESALALWQAEGFSLQGRLSVAIPPHRRIKPDGFRVVRTRVDDVDRTVRFGIPTMTFTRAAIGVAGRVTDKRCRVAIDDGIRNGFTSVAELKERATALGHTAGARRLLRMVGAGTFEHESEGERGLAGLFLPGDPLPTWQVWVLPDVRVDGAFLDARLVLEYDSRDWHLLPSDRDADGSRTLKMQAAQIAVIVVTAGMLRDQPEETRERILQVREERLRLDLPPIIPVQGMD